MADQQTDMKTHKATYDAVLGLLKWGAVASFVIAFFVIWLITGHHK